MRGIALLSGILFLLISISAVILVYQTGLPAVKKMQDASVTENMIDSFSELDKIIRTVASEGNGSKRTVYFKVDYGKIRFNGSEDSIHWTLETKSPSISPRTMKQFGNVIIGSNLNTKAYESNYTGAPPPISAYILENEYLKVYIKKLGSSDNFVPYNITDLILAIYQKDIDIWFNNSGLLNITLDNNAGSSSGNGYTYVEKITNHLPYAVLTAYMNSSYTNYSIDFILESGADFLEISGRA